MNEDRLKVLFICRAAVKDGMGHLFRCRSMIEAAPADVDAYLVTSGFPNQSVDIPGLAAPVTVTGDDADYIRTAEEIQPDVLMFDLNELDRTLFNRLAADRFTACLSPLFQHIPGVHQLYHRTSYVSQSMTGPEVFAGLEYAVVSSNSLPVSDNHYRELLSEPRFSVGINMGGSDAPNKTLEVLRALSGFTDESIIWVFLGVGYSHSYDLLVEESRHNPSQEVVLVKTSRNLWHVMKNCHLAILSGGVTSYDAAYAGMPAINLLHSPGHAFLLDELAEKGACFNLAVYGPEALAGLPERLTAINRDRERLWKMHRDARALIDGQGSNRIWRHILEGFKKYSRHLQR